MDAEGGKRLGDAAAVEFALAYATANHGTDRTVLDAHGVPCSPEMARLNNATYAVLSLAGSPGLPPPVQGFIEANEDKGCTKCWLSSRVKDQHPECVEKIHRYFKSRAQLIDYGDGLTNPPAAPKPEELNR